MSDVFEEKWVVARQAGRCVDYLQGWDVIWGPVWSSRKRARVFGSVEAADAAMWDALDIMRPSPWRTPRYSGATTLWVEHVHLLLEAV